MILVDTSVWIDHLSRGVRQLAAELEEQNVATHPFIVGELACGNLTRRIEILSSLKALPVVTVATDDEVLHFIERHQLFRLGLGWTDVHLLASTRLGDGVRLWTRDKALLAVAVKMNAAFGA